MKDLDTRLDDLRHAPQPPGIGAAAVREKAGVRARRRRSLVAAAAVVLAGAGAVGITSLDDPAERSGQRLEIGPAFDPPAAPADDPGAGPEPEPDRELGPPRTLGAVEGVAVQVSPRSDLTDGQMVEVTVEGLDSLPGALIILCAGDIDTDNAATSCDTAAVQDPEGDSDVQVPARAVRSVSVGRFIQIARNPTDPNQQTSYDCATEPAGCVLAVAPYEMPPSGVLVPISFRDEPHREPRIALAPPSGLSDSQAVTVEVEGTRANGGYLLTQCTADGDCDAVRWTRAESDGRGRITATLPVSASVYTSMSGRIDCTGTPCVVALRSPGGMVIASAPLEFARGTVAAEPRLELDPPGPYADGQHVTLRGSGFPPEIDLSSHLGQCPAHLDTSVEERCAYPAAMGGPVLVAEDGTFTTSIRISESLLFTGSCATGPGCVIGWVIPHGPTVAKAPLTFQG